MTRTHAAVPMEARTGGAERQRAEGLLRAIQGLSHAEALEVVEHHLGAMRGLCAGCGAAAAPGKSLPAAQAKPSHCAVEGRHEGPCIPKEAA